MPVTKLDSSDPRNNAALVISSGSLMGPIGAADATRALASQVAESRPVILVEDLDVGVVLTTNNEP